MAKYLDSDGVAYLWSKIKAKFATIISPNLTGTPTAPTAATGTNTQQIATTAFVQNTVSSMTSGVSGVKGDSESTYRTGNVNLTAANIGAAESSHSHGNITSGGDITATAPTIASGDCLVINDDSASKITNGPAFGSSTTTYLRNDGTWATPPDNNTDTKVTQTVDVSTTGTSAYPLLLTNTANKTATSTDTARFDKDVKVVPATGNLITPQLNGVEIGFNSSSKVYITVQGNGIDFDPVDPELGGGTLKGAAFKSVGSVASGNTGLVTGGDVYTAINNAVVGSLNYQGTVTAQSGLGTTYKKGYYWIVGSVTAGTQIAGQVVETGDMILAHADYSGTIANDVDVVQSNVDRMTNTDIDNAIAAGEAL